MSILDYILLAVLALCVFFAVRSMIKQKKAGKCLSCPSCKGCSSIAKCPKANAYKNQNC